MKEECSGMVDIIEECSRMLDMNMNGGVLQDGGYDYEWSVLVVDMNRMVIMN